MVATVEDTVAYCDGAYDPADISAQMLAHAGLASGSTPPDDTCFYWAVARASGLVDHAAFQRVPRPFRSLNRSPDARTAGGVCSMECG